MRLADCGVLYCRFLPAVDSSKQQQSLQRWMWMCVGLNQGELGCHCHRKNSTELIQQRNMATETISACTGSNLLQPISEITNLPLDQVHFCYLYFVKCVLEAQKPSSQLSLASRSFYKSFAGCVRKHLVRTMKTLHF